MDKKVIVFLAITIVLLTSACKKDKSCPNEYPTFSIPSTWLDSVDKNTIYNYYFKTKDSLTDVVTVSQYEAFNRIYMNDCGGHVHKSSKMAYFVSVNYNYRFVLHIDDPDDDGIGETQLDYQDPISYRYDLFSFDITDSSNNSVRLYSSQKTISEAKGHCVQLPAYTNRAGITFQNVFKFSTLSSGQSSAKPSNIKEFYCTLEFGLIEYTTVGGITFSFVKRKKL